MKWYTPKLNKSNELSIIGDMMMGTQHESQSTPTTDNQLTLPENYCICAITHLLTIME